MNTYQSNKIVKGFKITLIEGNTLEGAEGATAEVSDTFIGQQVPVIGAYYIVRANGSEAIKSPAAFEELYEEIDEPPAPTEPLDGPDGTDESTDTGGDSE